MSEVSLRYKDESSVWVIAENSVKQELSEVMTFDVPGCQYSPKYKSGIWDGKIRLFTEWSEKIGAGLVPDIAKFCARMGYSLRSDKRVLGMFSNPLYDEDALDAWLDDLFIVNEKGVQLILHEHQRLSIHACVKQRRIALLSPTSSGKSLIIYCVIRYLVEKLKVPGRVLLIVPTVGLVEQMHKDLIDYSSKDPTVTDDFRLHRIYAGKDKNPSGPRILISTWQSIYKLPKEWFSDFSTVFVDEAHLAKGKSIQAVMDRSLSAGFRMGFTGTLDGSNVNEMVIRSVLGPIRRFVTSLDLMDLGIVARLKIENIILKHTQEEAILASKMDYRQEIDFVIASRARAKLVASLCEGMNGNILALFKHKVHGRDLRMAFGEKKKVYLLSGDNPVEERMEVKRILETETDVIALASYGIFSTGESVKNIQHVVFAEPIKSRITVLQSIGRGLRVMDGKSTVTLWDLIDDLIPVRKNGTDGKTNYGMKHFRERVKIYDSEGFDYRTRRINISDANGDVRDEAAGVG